MSATSLALPHILPLAAIVGLAYFVRGMSGFGSGLIAIPLLSLYLPLPLALPAVALLDNLASMRHGLEHRDAIAWRDLLPLTPVSLLGTGCGLYLLHHVDTDLLKQCMAAFLLAYALLMLWRPTGFKRRSLSVALPFGAAGGMISTVFGTGGPFYVIYLHLRGQDPRPFRATIAAVFVLDGMVRLGGYLASGLLDWSLLGLVAIATPIMLAALLLGGLLHQRVSRANLDRLMSLLLLASGLVMFSA